MSLSTFIKLVTKAYKFTISRPLQRFNIEDRSVKHLGPDAKKFKPSPRAIGAISGLAKHELPVYPHLTPGYKSISQRRQAALESQPEDHVPKLKSYSEDEADDNLVIEASNKLDVVKTVARINPPGPMDRLKSGGDSELTPSETSNPSHRPLPRSTDLQLDDPRLIWQVKRTPPGRMNLNMLQELMLNKLADDKYWTPKAVAEKYNIREDYAEKLTAHMKQIRIRISPRMAKNLDYVSRNNPEYHASKHLIFHVDKSLRSDVDKKYDSMYLEKDKLPEDVRELIDSPRSLQLESEKELAPQRKRLERPRPLRLAPLNAPKQIDSSQQAKDQREVKRLEVPRGPRFSSDD